ncbi:MAG: hypothetical protein CM15mV100_150 [uncultured marine virus]|nr:MAG: hypothetical protein CM15mV100_150 [uncultured marine virus]
MENIVTITLLYLTLLGNIEMTSFEIPSKESCESWYHHNVKVSERKQRKMFSNLYYHEHDGKQVIGYVCGGDEPQ